MKIIFKKILVVLLIICTLLPSLFSGIVLAADDIINLNRERAGNYASNFAINFYENWSSVGVVGGNGNFSIGGNAVSTGKYESPLEVMKVNSEYAEWRNIRGKREQHFGTDLWGNFGDPIYSCIEGKVVQVYTGCTHKDDASDTCGNSYGNHVRVEDKNGIIIIYGHMQSVDVKLGDEVKQGQKLGEMGSSGSSTGKHLHLEFRTNNISILKQLKANSDFYWSPKKNSFTINPRVYIDFEKGATATQSTPSNQSTATIRGEIQTTYDEQATLNDIVEGETPYKFSNKSWIEFVYKYALNISAQSIAGLLDEKFDNEETIFEKELVKNGDIIDISTLINEGKVLPGDILYAKDGQGSGEYLLYVGGTKIIYAAPSPKTQTEVSTEEKESSEELLESALKYEYLQYYLERKKKDLIENQENSSEQNIPPYGVTKIYRIKDSIATAKTEEDTNLFFDGKGYYSESTPYSGIPTNLTYNSTEEVGIFKWIFDSLIGFFEFILNTILYTIRMQIVGWINMVELLLQSVILGISGNADLQMVSNFFGPDATSASGSRITVESIFFNQIPILDANFFNFESAGGYSLINVEKYQPATASGQAAYDIVTPQSNNIVYQLRYNLRFWYAIIRSASIALLLFILIYLGIRLAITSSSEKKAQTKKVLTAWVTAFIVVFFLHYFMYLVLDINSTLVNVCKEICQNSANEIVQNTTNQELNLYDAVRIKAYSFSFVEGVPATILYIYLIYLLIRFTLIYLKRYVTIYILALSGAFMGVKYALERITGKKSKSLSKWMVDFAFNVLLQTVHAFIYVIYMSIAIKLSQTSLFGFAICLIVLNFMLNADKIIMKIFGLNKAGSLSEVDKPESFMQWVGKFAPMYFVYKKAYDGAQKYLFGKRGFISEVRYSLAGFDNYRDAEKEFERRKYEGIGKRQKIISDLYDSIASSNKLKWARDRGISVRKMANKIGIGKYREEKLKLNADNSLATKKAIYNSIKKAKQSDMKRYTRPLGFVKDIALGFGGIAASTAVFIADPAAGAVLFQKSKKALDSHRTLSKKQRKYNVYKVPNNEAKLELLKARNRYNKALNLYTDNQFDYEEKRRQLLSAQALETDTAIIARYQDLIDDLDRERKEEEAKELHELEVSYGEMFEADVLYKNAQYENNRFMKAAGAVTGATLLENMFQNEVTGMYKDSEAYAKEQKRLAALEKFEKDEEDVRNLMRELKGNWESSGGTMDNTINVAKKSTVGAHIIKAAISKYMFENKIKFLSDEHIDGVIEIIKEKLEESGSQVVLSEDFERNIRSKIKDKMIEDKKGLGLDKKDAAAAISSILGEQHAVELTVSNSVMARAMEKHMVDNGTDTITDTSVDNIVREMQKLLKKEKSTIIISSSIKDDIKREITDKMAELGTTTGIDTETAIKAISSVLRRNRVVEHKYNRKLSRAQVEYLLQNNVKVGTQQYEDYLLSVGFELEDIKNERKRHELEQKTRDLYTKNETAKVKLGSSLVTMSKVVKEAKKLGK